MKKLFITILLAVPPLLLLAEGEQTLVVQSKDGTKNKQLLSEVQRITFNAGSVTVVSKDGQTTPFSLSEVQKILFSRETGISGIDEVTESAAANTNRILLYPNPVQDVLYVEGIEENTMIRIFNIKGALFQSAIAKEKEVQLNVGALPQGMYILQAGNQAIRFIKK